MKKLTDIFSLPLIITIIMMITVFLKYKLNFPLILILLIYSVLTILLIMLFFFTGIKKFNHAIIIIWAVLIVFFFKLNNTDNTFAYFNKIITDNCAIIGDVCSYPEIKNSRTEAVIRVLGIKKMNITDYIKSKSKFKILLKINTSDKFIYRGNIVLVNKKFKIPVEKVFNYNYRENLFYKNIYGLIYCETDDVKIVDNKIFKSIITDLITGRAGKIREKSLKILSEGLNYNSYTFIQSVFFGIRSELDKDIIRQFSNTGLIHLIAISGLHFGFLGIIVFKIFNLLFSKSKSLIITVIFLSLYILTISESASSLRAFYMYLIASLFFIAGINSSALSILSFSAIILFFINPFYLFDLGFKFSFFATAGIILFNEMIKGKIYNKLPEKIKNIFSVTLSAFLSVFMLQWAVFEKVPFFSLISSVFVVPFFTLVFIALFFLIIFALLFKVLIVFRIIDLICILFLKIISLLDLIPSAELFNIPEYFSLIFFIFLIFYFYCLDPLVRKLFIILKLRFFN